MQYHFNEIEKRWRDYWAENKTFKAEDNSVKPKYYVLDMFPYPSGAGLHVGHPLGYIASDVFARYKRLQGFNVLHPMGYDSFGLPAEQYAIQTGQHPAITTKTNIEGGKDKDGNVIPGYRNQLDKIGFSLIGIERLELQAQIITNGHNGSLNNCLILGITLIPTKQNTLIR